MISGSPNSPWYTREMLNMMGKLRLQVAKLLKNEGKLEISSKYFFFFFFFFFHFFFFLIHFPFSIKKTENSNLCGL